MSFENIGKGIVKRTNKRVLGLFIDGIGLDRATRRLNRKVDMAALVRGVTSGIPPIVARYYTLVPYEDDSRQRAFLDAVARANLSVVVKRLPPKGVNRQVSTDVELAADMVAFAKGHSSFSSLCQYLPEEFTAAAQANQRQAIPFRVNGGAAAAAPAKEAAQTSDTTSEDPTSENHSAVAVQRIVVVVCPSRDLSYPIALVKELGADTVTADFGQFSSGDILKSAAKWIDLTDSETIWRETSPGKRSTSAAKADDI